MTSLECEKSMANRLDSNNVSGLSLSCCCYPLHHQPNTANPNVNTVCAFSQLPVLASRPKPQVGLSTAKGFRKDFSHPHLYASRSYPIGSDGENGKGEGSDPSLEGLA